MGLEVGKVACWKVFGSNAESLLRSQVKVWMVGGVSFVMTS